MHTLNWQGKTFKLQSHNVQVGEHQLELRRCYLEDGGTPLMLFPGFLQTGQVFLPADFDHAGLATFLADRGFDVYLPELRGKGGSWPTINRHSTHGFHEAVCQDIPAHAAALAKLRPDQPQIWFGHGLGSLLMLAAYARMEQLEAPLLGMVHTATGRHCQPVHWRRRLELFGLRLFAGFNRLNNGYLSASPARERRRETTTSWKQWRVWRTATGWLDPVDDFDYEAALADCQLPASLYLACADPDQWSNVKETRAFMQMLGKHNARLLVVGKSGGNLHDYPTRELLSHPDSCEDHFQQILAWLREQEAHGVAQAPVSRAAI